MKNEERISEDGNKTIIIYRNGFEEKFEFEERYEKEIKKIKIKNNGKRVTFSKLPGGVKGCPGGGVNTVVVRVWARHFKSEVTYYKLPQPIKS